MSVTAGCQFVEGEAVRVMSFSGAEQVPGWGFPVHVPVDELARPDLFESDDELDEFLADLYASRRAGSA